MHPQTAADLPASQAWAEKLGLPVQQPAAYWFEVGATGVQLLERVVSAPGPIRVDFVAGVAAYRRKHGGGSGELIARAVGVAPGVRPYVLDATAGLGRDAFVLASLGSRVVLVERHPLVAALLADGLARAAADPEIALIVARMQLQQADAIELLMAGSMPVPQVIYLDPMFPKQDKQALVKKEMRLFRPLVGADADAPALLAAALEYASHRVVVKRPRKAPPIEGATAQYCIEGKSSRFDVYPLQSLKTL